MSPRVPRYPSDLTDAQWALIEPLVPGPSKDGRKPKHRRRDLVDAILYVARTGCAWRALPADFPPWATVYFYFARWHDEGVTTRMHDALRAQVRATEGRAPDATAGIIDSQSVKGADTVGRDSRGYDAGKKINGRKRFIITDTLGLLLVVMVCSAGLQDRDGAKGALLRLHVRHRRTRHVFADGGFAGQLLAWSTRLLQTTIDIVRKPADQRGFAVIPRRWAVERSFSWITAHRRLARDYERTTTHAEAFVYWAMIGTMTRRLARGRAATRPGPRPLTRTNP
jgi:transposase